jgi:hypothetical protein
MMNWEEVTVLYLYVLFGVHLEELRKLTKSIIRIAILWADILHIFSK